MKSFILFINLAFIGNAQASDIPTELIGQWENGTGYVSFDHDDKTQCQNNKLNITNNAGVISFDSSKMSCSGKYVSWDSFLLSKNEVKGYLNYQPLMGGDTTVIQGYFMDTEVYFGAYDKGGSFRLQYKILQSGQLEMLFKQFSTDSIYTIRLLFDRAKFSR